MTANETDLIQRMKAGSDTARREFWGSYYPVVFRSVWFGARHTSEADAEEIAQEVFIRAFKGIAKFDGRSSLKTWLFTIARNATIDFYRAHTHYDMEIVDHDEAFAAREATVNYVASTADPPEPLRYCLVRQESDRLRDWIALLTEEQRTVFIHRLIDGLSVAETANLLHKSEGAVKMALFRALDTLRALAERERREEREEVAIHG